MKRWFILAGICVGVAGASSIPKVVLWDANDPRGQVIVYSSDPNDVQAWYDTFVAPRVEAQVRALIADPNTLIDSNDLSAAITSSEQRTWQRMVEADAANNKLTQTAMISRMSAELQAWLSEL